MNSYDRSGVAEKLRVMVGMEDCFANLEATGLRVLSVFIMGYRLCDLQIGKSYRVLRTKINCSSKQYSRVAQGNGESLHPAMEELQPRETPSPANQAAASQTT
jgi:hypothetical protein